MNFERSAIGLVGVLLTALSLVALSTPDGKSASIPTASITRVSMFIAAPPRAANAESLYSTTAAKTVRVNSTKMLSGTFMNLGYNLQSIINGNDRVPRLFLVRLPADIAKIRENNLRKSIFFQSVLPLILQVNEELAADRQRLWRLRFKMAMAEKIIVTDRLWLAIAAKRYKIKNTAINIKMIDSLLSHVDIIPPSIALAQSAEESGWGTSRFAREGNAVFGQWTFSKNSTLTPLKRDKGMFHRIRAFDNLIDSVRAYAQNINTHRAYRKFRRTRSKTRQLGKPLDGKILVTTLKSYSARGEKYVATISSIIEANNLRRLDDARLGDALFALTPSI